MQIDNEEKSGLMANYKIFMAMADKVGHDKRGTPIFIRDEEGEDILFEKTTVTGEISKERVVDDQTELIPLLFEEWKKAEGFYW